MAGVALVLGGASGIGAAAAHALAEQRHRVAIADLSAATSEQEASRLPGDGHLAVACDIADEASVTACFDRVEDRLGPIRVLVITAGTAGLIDGRRPSVRTTSLASWDRVMGINAGGTFLAIREMLIRRERAPVEHGRIITISSITAQAVPRQAPISYAASKGAVLAMTRVAAVDAAPCGMTVNAIAPGVVDTPMLREAFTIGEFKYENLTGPMGQPADIAAVIAFLASPAAAFVNGACLDVNGGYVMR